MLSYLLIILFSFSKDVTRIENGNVVSPSESLSRAVVHLKFSNGSSCSGAFLTSRVILTAGHCTHRKTPEGTEVVIVDKNGKKYSQLASRVITHPDYKLTNSMWGTIVSHDAGLVTLAKAFPITVPTFRIGNVTSFATPRTVTIVGYGYNRPKAGSGTLRKGTMTAVVAPIDSYDGEDGLLMKPNNQQWLCGGDSGGPVIDGTSSSRTLVGINSMSSGCKNYSEAQSIAEIAWDMKPWIKQYAPDIK